MPWSQGPVLLLGCGTLGCMYQAGAAGDQWWGVGMGRAEAGGSRSTANCGGAEHAGLGGRMVVERRGWEGRSSRCLLLWQALGLRGAAALGDGWAVLGPGRASNRRLAGGDAGVRSAGCAWVFLEECSSSSCAAPGAFRLMAAFLLCCSRSWGRPLLKLGL